MDNPQWEAKAKAALEMLIRQIKDGSSVGVAYLRLEVLPGGVRNVRIAWEKEIK